MTIKKGEAWGSPAPLPPDGVVADNDAAARAALERARADGRPFPVLGLTGGDLWRTLGAPETSAERLRSAAAVTFTVDLGEILVDGRMHLFVAHAMARTRTWSRAWLAMNAQWLGEWNTGPKAHPNDGRLDVYEAALPLSDRFKVRARLRSGAHLPHPGIVERRTKAAQIEFRRPLPVRLDGERIGAARTLSVRVEPDAIQVVV